MAVGYLQNKNNNTVIELYNMFSRYRWQTYILAEAAMAIMGPGMATAAMATPTATVRAISAPGAAHRARAPTEVHARGGGAGDMDGGPRGHENWGVYGAGGAPGVGRGDRGPGGGGGGLGQPAPPRPPPRRRNPPPVPPRGVSCRNPYLLKNEQYY